MKMQVIRRLAEIADTAIADIHAELTKPHQKHATDSDIIDWIKEWGFEHIADLTTPSKYTTDWCSDATAYNDIVEKWAMGIYKHHFWIRSN